MIPFCQGERGHPSTLWRQTRGKEEGGDCPPAAGFEIIREYPLASIETEENDAQPFWQENEKAALLLASKRGGEKRREGATLLPVSKLRRTRKREWDPLGPESKMRGWPPAELICQLYEMKKKQRHTSACLSCPASPTL